MITDRERQLPNANEQRNGIDPAITASMDLYCPPLGLLCDSAFSEKTARLLDFFVAFVGLEANELSATRSPLVLLPAEKRHRVLLARACPAGL
jgi:hypothetical protein